MIKHMHKTNTRNLIQTNKWHHNTTKRAPLIPYITNHYISPTVWDKLFGSVPPMVMSSKSPTHVQINKEEKTTKE